MINYFKYKISIISTVQQNIFRIQFLIKTMNLFETIHRITHNNGLHF